MFQFPPYTSLILLSTLISMAFAGLMWSRRPGEGSIPFVVLAIGLTIWTSSNFAKLVLTPISAKIIFTHITYFGITIVPAAWLYFIIEYTGNNKWATKRNILILCIEPILVQLALLTNPSHLAFFPQFTLVTIDNMIIDQTGNGILFWLHAGYSYVLLVISCVILLHKLMRSPQLFRGQVVYLLIGVFAPWIANVVFLAGWSPLPRYIDLTPLAFVITIVAVGWSMYRFRLLDLVPIARDVIVDSMEEAIIVLDNRKRVVDVNNAALKLLNRPATDVVGQFITDILANQQDLVRKFKDVDQVETEIKIDISGQPRFFKLRISGIYNKQGEVSGNIIVLHDITTLREANIALELANEKAQEMTRLKGQFLATMSHELRTPLNAIIGYTELQLAGIVGELSDMQKQYQERVFSNANHLLGLINDVLDLSKIEAGRMELIKQPFNLRDWVDEIVEQNIVLAEDKNIQFVVDIDAYMPDVLIGDSGRLRQIVVNLISNAIKFTSVGSVALRISSDDERHWAIAVQDTGIGIPSHKLETIFEEFQQADNTSTRQYGGTGLGLAIVRKLTLAMGGTVRLSSTVGEGSLFTVTLPMNTDAIKEIDILKV